MTTDIYMNTLSLNNLLLIAGCDFHNHYSADCCGCECAQIARRLLVSKFGFRVPEELSGWIIDPNTI